MKRTKRMTALLLAAVCLFSFLPVTVQANSPPPAPYYVFELSGLPEGTVYVDLLIKLPESAPEYVALEKSNLPKGFSPESEIVTFCEDDFRSYTFHYENAKSIIRVQGDNQVYFFIDDLYDLSFEVAEHKFDVDENGWIRLAMLDGQGNILKVSPVLSVKSRQFFGSIRGRFQYNGTTDEYIAETDVNGSGVVLYLILCWFALLFTCLIEYLVAIPFGLRKRYGGKIFLVNIISQIAMHLCHILLYSIVFWRYPHAVILLEVLVYCCEFAVYRRIMREESPVKCIGYVAVANTASLALGLLFIL